MCLFVFVLGGYLRAPSSFQQYRILLIWSHGLHEQTENNLCESCPHLFLGGNAADLVGLICVFNSHKCSFPAFVLRSLRHTVLYATEKQQVEFKASHRQKLCQADVTPCLHKDEPGEMASREGCWRYTTLSSLSEILKYTRGSHRIAEELCSRPCLEGFLLKN